MLVMITIQLIKGSVVMTAIAIGVFTGGIFVATVAIMILGVLELLGILESTVRAHWPQAPRPAAEHRSVHTVTHAR
jgi:hypothetical protein